MIVLAFSFLAGVLTILSPCVLPIVPILVGAGLTGRRGRLPGVVLGFGGAFVATTVLLASVLAAAGFTTDRLKLVSALLLAGFGLAIAVPRIGAQTERLTHLVVRMPGPGLQRRDRAGFGGGLVLGAAIGLVWAPCVGPIMAAVIAAAVVSGPTIATLSVAVAYVAGAALPLAAVASFGRRAANRFGSPNRRSGATRAFGVATVAAALAIATGADVPLQAAATGFLPAGWSSTLASVEQQPGVLEELDVLRRQSNLAVSSGDDPSLPAPIAPAITRTLALEDLGPAPELTGITSWINSEPLTIQSLRGKVVLVHFWTFGCINCIHVQPYVKAWYERYAGAGLVVIGVHTPELSFERDITNVRDAVRADGIAFPVAFDPSFETWNAYRNSYWPAFYFVDRAGRIRHVHFGEGDYDGSEQVIRELLAQS